MAAAAISFAVMFCSSKFVRAASAPVDANGNSLPNSEVAGAVDSQAELAQKLQNPVSNVISLPFQNNFDFDMGPNDDGFRYTLNFQPVVPVSIHDEDENHLWRELGIDL